jgi:type II secretory pathway pseudopilin PulG
MLVRLSPSPACRRSAAAGVFATARSRVGGFTILELVAGAAMLAVLMAIIGQLVAQMNRQSAVAERRQYALTTIENVMEQLTARPWSEISDDAVSEFDLPAELTKRWPAAALSGNVVETSETLVAKQISLKLTLSSDGRERPLSLTTWIYRSSNEEASP